MKRRAFTLVELLVVISIIGLLSSIAVVSMSGSRDKAKIAAGQSFDSSLRNGLGDQLVGEWLMNECSGNTASDASGSGNTATWGGGAGWSTSNAPGGTGCSASFSGSNYLGTAFNLQSPNVTFSAWIYPTDTSGFNGIVNKSLQYRYIIDGGKLRSLISCNGTSWNGADFVGIQTVSTNTWSMAALSIDSVNRTATLYLNGNISGKVALACAISSYNNELLSIGSDLPNSSYHPFDGNIDDVRVYTSALSLSQIEKMYAEGLPSHRLAAANK